MIYQNSPSRPEPLTLEPGKLRAQLLTLYKKAFGIKPRKLTIVETDGFYGDVRIEDPKDDNVMVYVSFAKADRKAAFKELGLNTKKLALFFKRYPED